MKMNEPQNEDLKISIGDVIVYVVILFAFLFLFTGCTPDVAAEPTDACTITGDNNDENVTYYKCSADITSAYTIFCSGNEGPYECMKVYHKPGEPRE